MNIHKDVYNWLKYDDLCVMIIEMKAKSEEISYVQNVLLNWFVYNGRRFPWRKENATNFEKVVSEVLLQRTKAESVSKFYPYFLEKYNSWETLGQASETELSEVLKPIGLYKQRASRLYKLAQLMKVRKGIFPRKRNLVEEMPMMGQYITNSYELFILNKKRPLLDVNMARLIERLFGKRKLADIRYDKELQITARKLITHDNCIKLNWAILDFAQLVCKSRKPICNDCVLNSICKFYITMK